MPGADPAGLDVVGLRVRAAHRAAHRTSLETGRLDLGAGHELRSPGCAVRSEVQGPDLCDAGELDPEQRAPGAPGAPALQLAPIDVHHNLAASDPPAPLPPL